MGEATIKQGILAGVAGLALTLIFILIYYRFAGILALLGLGISIAIIFGTMAMFQFTLTLPGIAVSSSRSVWPSMPTCSFTSAFERRWQPEITQGSDRHGIRESFLRYYRCEHHHTDHRDHPLRAGSRNGEGIRHHLDHRYFRDPVLLSACDSCLLQLGDRNQLPQEAQLHEHGA